MQVASTSAQGGFAERMPSFTSLITGPPQKRKRCLKFQTSSDQENSSQGRDQPSLSASLSQQESHGGTDHPLPQSTIASTSQSEHIDGPCPDKNVSSIGVAAQHSAVTTGAHRQSAQARPSSRQLTASSAALPALTAAMGSQMPSAATSAASQAAAAAAVTPVTSRYVSSHSGERDIPPNVCASLHLHGTSSS